VSQLSSDIDGDTINADDVEKYYEGMAGVSGFSISDAMFEGRVTAAITALRWAIERDPNVGPMVIATAANALRGLVAVQGAPSGIQEAELARIAGIPPWKVRSVRDTVRKWRPASMADAALLLTRADAALKGGEIDELGRIEVLEPIQRQALLERTVVSIARSSGR
jgi:DNA polymerase-3 subunit delta